MRFSPETNVLLGLLLSTPSEMNIFDLPPFKKSSSSSIFEGCGRKRFALMKRRSIEPPGLMPPTRRNRGRVRGRLCCAFVAALALVSCNNDKIEVYSIPKKGVTVAMQNGMPGMPPAPVGNPAKWVKPEGWSEQPLTEMRLGSFKVDGSNATSADVSVTAFPGDAGGLAPNVNRWRGQLQLPPLEEAQLQQTIQRTEVEGVQTYLVDLQTPENAPKPSRILGAVLETPDRTWFVKMTGSPELIESQRQKFLNFVKSFRFTSVTEGQVPETAGTNMPKSTNDK